MWPEDVQHHQRPLNLIDAQTLARTDLPYLQRAEALPVARAVKVLLHREVDKQHNQGQPKPRLPSRNDVQVAQKLREIAKGIQEDMVRPRRLHDLDDRLQQEEAALDRGLFRRQRLSLSFLPLVEGDGQGNEKRRRDEDAPCQHL